MAYYYFFLNGTPAPEIYTTVHTLSLHDALPIFEALDHASVQVVGIHAQAALREEVPVGVGHREPGDVEDADVHRRHRRIRLLAGRSEAHTSELQSLMRISYAVFCQKKKHSFQSSIKDK